MEAFTLVGVDGNAYSVMGYTARALRTAGLRDKVDEMYNKATSGDYNNLLCVCMEYCDLANKELGLDEYEEEEEEESTDRFSLVGVDGNAYSVMAYTAKALRTAGLKDKVDEMHARATEGDYDHLLAVCIEYVDMANEAVSEDRER